MAATMAGTSINSWWSTRGRLAAIIPQFTTTGIDQLTSTRSADRLTCPRICRRSMRRRRRCWSRCGRARASRCTGIRPARRTVTSGTMGRLSATLRIGTLQGTSSGNSRGTQVQLHPRPTTARPTISAEPSGPPTHRSKTLRTRATTAITSTTPPNPPRL